MLRVTWPVGRGSKMTTYLEFPRPYYLFTIQLLWTYDDDYWPFIGEIFIQERFWPKILVRFWAKFLTFGGFFRGQILTSNFCSRKGLTLAWSRVVRAIVRENPPGGLTCRSVNKKKLVYTIEKFSLYFTHLPRSPQWTDLHEILHRGRLADVITCFKFCVDRLRGFGSARGRILPFSLYLAGRH